MKKEEELHMEKIRKYTEKKQREELEIKNKNLNKIQQPTMRYRPRTDLERIYYTVNAQSMGKISKDIVDSQLAKMNLNNLKKTTNPEEANKMEALLEKYKDIDEDGIEELRRQKDFLKAQGYDEKNSESVKNIVFIINNYESKLNTNVISPKPNEDEKNKNKNLKKNGIDNAIVRKLNGDFNFKTFFKAASVYSFKLDDYKAKMNKLSGANSTRNNFRKFDFNNNNINNLTAKNIKNKTFTKKFEFENSFSNKKNKHNTSAFSQNLNKENESKDNISIYPEFDPRDEPDKEKEDFLEEMQFGSNLNILNENNFRLNTLEGNDINFNNTNNEINNNKNNNFRARNLSTTNYKKFGENLKKINTKENNMNTLNNNNSAIDNNNDINNKTFNTYNYNPTMTSDFFNPGKKKEECLTDEKKLMYLKRIATSNTLMNDNFISPSKFKSELPNFLQGYLKKKSKIKDQANSIRDKKSSMADSDNIFVKACLIEQMETKKCKEIFKVFLFKIFFIFSFCEIFFYFCIIFSYLLFF